MVGLLLMDAIVAYRMLVLQRIVAHSHSTTASTEGQRVHGRRIRRVVGVQRGRSSAIVFRFHFFLFVFLVSEEKEKEKNPF